MKIAMYNLTTTCRFGGVETFVWEISKELARRGMEVHIVGGRGGIHQNIPNAQVRLFPFWPREHIPDLGSRFRKFAERLSMGFFALSAILREKYDIFHIHKPFDLPIGLMAKKIGNSKLILGSHGTDFFAGDRIFAHAVDAAVSCSQFNGALISRRYGLKPQVIYNGIDPQFFHPFLPPDLSLQKKLAIAKEDNVIIYVGRLVGLKGVKVLLQALGLLKNRLKIKLLIAGEGGEKVSLQTLAEHLGISQAVIFTGFVPHEEIPRYYSLARLAAFPSLADEAFGISICEAMACGLAIISTSVGGIPELIRDGQTGFLAAPGDELDLADKIQKILENHELRRNMGEQAAQRAQQYFTWAKVADRLQEVYEKTLEEKTPP